MTAETVVRPIDSGWPDTRKHPVMNIVFMAHPDFCGHLSMPRFHKMLVAGMQERGHNVQTLTPAPRFYKLPAPPSARKWLGYIDQFAVFPREVKKALKTLPENSLFVFTDNGLGPWVPLAAHLPHVIHCHDFLAQRAAYGSLPEQRQGWTGRMYQRMIRNGYVKGKNFISGSANTCKDLHSFLADPPKICELVYNGLHKPFKPYDMRFARNKVSELFGCDLSKGYLLHVGGNQWYKNRKGVIEIYNAWRASSSHNLPLVLLGLSPAVEVAEAYRKSPYKSSIHIVTNSDDNAVNLAYSGASAFLFPSKAEGFGWPIAEAQASGCPVITTNEAPMTEVAGDAGFFIALKTEANASSWAKKSAEVVEHVISLSSVDRAKVVANGIRNAGRFDTDNALDRIEAIYRRIVDEYIQAK